MSIVKILTGVLKAKFDDFDRLIAFKFQGETLSQELYTVWFVRKNIKYTQIEPPEECFVILDRDRN